MTVLRSTLLICGSLVLSVGLLVLHNIYQDRYMMVSQDNGVFVFDRYKENANFCSPSGCRHVLIQRPVSMEAFAKGMMLYPNGMIGPKGMLGSNTNPFLQMQAIMNPKMQRKMQDSMRAMQGNSAPNRSSNESSSDFDAGSFDEESEEEFGEEDTSFSDDYRSSDDSGGFSEDEGDGDDFYS